MTATPFTFDILVRMLRWHKPAGRLILLIPALWAVFLAGRGQPQPSLVLLIITGTFATSALGCVVNDLWDKDIDPLVERTKKRPLAAREVTIVVAVAVAAVSLLCAWGLTFFLSRFTFWLCLAAVPFILGYPAAKRIFPVPQLILSLCWGFAVLISWSAVTGGLDWATAWLWGATVCWTLGFDTIYALSDREDDLKIGINSSAIFFGKFTPQAIGLFFLATVMLLGMTGWQLRLSLFFYVILLLAGLLWVRQYQQLSQSHIPMPLYEQLFNDNVKIGFLLLAGMVIGRLT